MASTMALSRLALTARTTRPPACRRYAVAGRTAGPEYRRRRGAATRRVGVRRSEADASQDTARATLLAAAADPTDDDAAARTTLRAIESAWAEAYVPGGVDPVVGGGGAVPSDTSLRVIASLPLEELCQAACRVRDLGHRVINFSPKVFIPLIQACRDECGYCVFATAPPQHRPAFMSLDQVLDVAQAGAAAGCTEALFTLGDKPELKYPSVREELDALGLASTLEYLQVAAAMVLERTGLVPHVNAGVMSQAEVRALRAVSGSQGLMLESTSPRLMDPGGPHYNCPDKLPEARLATVAAAGAARVPFTSGLLVGLGETEEERMDAMLALRDLHAQYGHLQELIIQNFVAKAGTAMADVPSAPLHVLRHTVAMTRLAFGPVMSVQAPPNLAPDGAASWSALLAAGINDWGGISPVTRDFVNPEAPWPHLSSLAATTAAAGFHLVPRLTVYPRYFLNSSHNHTTDAHDDPTALPSDPSSATSQPLLPWVHEKVAPAVRRLADAHGLSRASDWFAGDASEVAAAEGAAETRRYDAVRTAVDGTLDFSTTNENLSRRKRGGSEMEAAGVQDGSPYTATVGSEEEAHCRHVSTDVRAILDKVQAAAATRVQEGSARAVATLGAGLGAVGGEGLSQEEVARLFECRGADFRAVCEAADALRRSECGDEVSYTVNRNINYTNVCLLSCSFCAFSKGKAAEALRGPSYTLPLDEITWRTAEAWDRGATEVCMQGGIHPDFDGDTYVRIVEAAKRGAPDVHVHAFSPLEVQHGSAAAGVPVPQYLRRLRDAGLSSLPGTAAEVLDDAVRAVLCPDKLSAGEWLEVVSEAHGVGLPTTATLMFGHVDTPVAWAKHLLQLRELQAATGGLTEFVPLPFVHMEAPLYLRGGARRGPTLRESILVHAVARLALFPHVRNVQASWVKMGPQHAAALLSCGCNDVGGVLMNESITRAAGAAHGQSLSAAEMEALVEAVGRTPRQRTTLYADAPAERRRRSLSDAAYMPLASLRLN